MTKGLRIIGAALLLAATLAVSASGLVAADVLSPPIYTLPQPQHPLRPEMHSYQPRSTLQKGFRPEPSGRMDIRCRPERRPRIAETVPVPPLLSDSEPYVSYYYRYCGRNSR